MMKSFNLLQPKEEEKMLENLNLRIENEFLQKRLTFKEKEVEELKARVEALSKTLAELKEKQEVDTIISEKEEAIVEQLSRLYQKNRTRRKEGKKAEELKQKGILPLKRKTTPSTSDDVKELALSFENLAPISDPGMKRIDGSKKLPGLSFLGNIFPTEDGTKETTSTSVESVPSTKKVPDEAFVLHEFPFLNIPPPDSPRMLSKRPILCEECNKHHVPYYYCFNQPCSACYSKDHHFIKCPYLRYIPKGVDFNRDVYEVGCGCGNLFDEEEWLCSLCPEGTKSTILKAKICYYCKRIGEHCAWECPEYKDKAARYRSFRDEKFATSKARKAESLAKSSQSPSPNSLEDSHDRLVFYKS